MSIRAIAIVFLVTGLAFMAAPQNATADYIGGITVSHPSPSYLPHGETVVVEFDYKIDDPDGAYVYVRPFTLDNLTPGYGAQGGTFRTGTGTATRTFTINSGDRIVTHLRVYTRDAITNEIELEIFIPVRLVFGPHGVFNLQMNHNQYDRLPYGENLVINFDYLADVPDGCKIFARPFTDGTLTPGYSASGSGDLPPSGSYSQNFSFGADTDVTDIRFQVKTLDQQTLLYEIFVPFDIHWALAGIYNINFDWPDESSLQNAQNLNSNFIFDHDTPEGLFVSMACATGGSLTPGVVWQPTPLYPAGSASVNRFTRVNTGEGFVDGMQFWVNDADSNPLMSFIVPVNYHYAPHAIQNPVFVPAAPAILSNGEDLNMTFDYHSSHDGDVLIFARPAYDLVPLFGISSGGSPSYPPGSGSGGYHFRFDAGEHLASHVRFQMKNSDQSVILLEHFYSGFWSWGTTQYITPVPDTVPVVASNLGLCFPNPFNPTTSIPLFLAQESHVRLGVYDLRGRLVQTLQNNIMASGNHVFTFKGDGLPSGGYICRLETPDGVQTQRLTLVK